MTSSVFGGIAAPTLVTLKLTKKRLATNDGMCEVLSIPRPRHCSKSRWRRIREQVRYHFQQKPYPDGSTVPS